MISIEETCKILHQELYKLPTFTSPENIPFENGLYFFYEKEEISEHGESKRVVRIGNHPISVNGLKKRIRNHYRNNKANSVFRRFLGGALIRRNDPQSDCLLPSPGSGHWEKSKNSAKKSCVECKVHEHDVTEYIKNNCCFRCVRLDDKTIRNQLEKQLISTFYNCSVCRPNGNWLGKYAYPCKINKGNLWQVDHLHHEPLSEEILELFIEMISDTENLN